MPIFTFSFEIEMIFLDSDDCVESQNWNVQFVQFPNLQTIDILKAFFNDFAIENYPIDKLIM